MAEEKRKEQQFRLEVDANEIAQIKEGEFEGTITAIQTRGSRAAANQQIQLYLAGQPFGNSVPTDENGRVVKDFSITTAAKTISVEAQTVGFATRAKKFINLPRTEKEMEKTPEQEMTEKKIAELKSQTKLAQAKNELKETKEKLKPKQHEAPKENPDCLNVTFAGKHGKQKLTISVSTADGSFLIGFVGTIVDGGEKKSFKTLEDGTAVYDADFNEESRVFEVRAGNTKKLIWRARLLGPESEGNNG